MTLISVLTTIYLWLAFTVSTNGQFSGASSNIFSPQSQSPLTGGRQNYFSPGTQFPSHQTTNPQNIPQVTNPQNFPQVTNPQNFPQVTNPQNFPRVINSPTFPQVTNPQNFLQTHNPYNVPQVTNPQNFPRVMNPQNFPRVINPQNFPPVTNPRNIPQISNPQNFPQRNHPQNVRQPSNPHNFPQGINSQNYPQIINPHNIPQGINPHNFPQIFNPRNIPQVTNLHNVPQATNPYNNPQVTNPQIFPQGINTRNIPQRINPQNSPQVTNPQNFPQANNFRNIPQVTNPHNILQTTNPQNNPQIINSHNGPQVPNRDFNVPEILRAIFSKDPRFNPRPVNHQNPFSPQNTAPHNPIFNSHKPNHSFSNPRRTHPFHTGTQGSNPAFTNPQNINKPFTNPQQINHFNHPLIASQIPNAPPFISPSSLGHHPINPGFIAPQQANPSPTKSQGTIPITDSSQTNRDSLTPQPDSTSPQKTNSDSQVLAPTNSDSTVPEPINSDTTIPEPTTSDSIVPAPTNSDTTITEQDESLATTPQQTYSDPIIPQKANPTLDDTQPIASASESSSTVSKAPQNTSSLSIAADHPGPASHNRPKYIFHPGKQTNPQSHEDPLRGLRIVCLFNNKHYMTSGFTPANIDPKFCTHVNYEFAVLDPATYEIIIGEPDLDVEENFYTETIALKHVNPKLKILLSLGGWGDSTKKYSELADDPAKRQNFVIKAVEFLTKHGFDGLDLAWEYPNCWQGAIGVSPKDKQNFISLLKDIKPEFEKKGLILSASVGAIKREVEAAYDVPEVSKNVDYINVMTYDMHGPWESKTSHHVQFEAMPGDTDPYCNVKGGMQVWIEKGADKRKLNMGMAFYGRSFTMKSSDRCEMGVPAIGVGKPGDHSKQGGLLSYNEICKYLNSGNWSEKQDRHAGFYACYGDQWAGYDPPMMMVRKTKYVVESGLGGVLLKDLSGDDFRGECFGKGMPFPLLRMVKMEMEHKAKQKYS